MSSAKEEEEEKEDGCANAAVLDCKKGSTPEDTVSSKKLNNAKNTPADFDECEIGMVSTILSHIRDLLSILPYLVVIGLILPFYGTYVQIKLVVRKVAGRLRYMHLPDRNIYKSSPFLSES
jgi:hypothetical protein